MTLSLLVSRSHLAAIAVFFLFAPAIGVASCTLGEEEAPGCRADAECAQGSVCRGGACFRITTGLSPPSDPDEDEDAGDGGPPD